MRLYAKLIPLVAVFVFLISPAGQKGVSELAYQARVQAVLRFGSQADFDALVDDTQRRLAAENGRVDLYDAGKRYREMLAAAVADAARRNVPLTEQLLDDLQVACARDAFGSVRTRRLAAESYKTRDAEPDLGARAGGVELLPPAAPRDP